MIKAVTCSIGLIFLWASAPSLEAQPPEADSLTKTAADTAAQMQALSIEMRLKLAEAQGAQAKGDTFKAAKLYQDAWDRAQIIGNPPETETIRAGLANVRMALAHEYNQHANYREADTQVRIVLRLYPQ